MKVRTQQKIHSAGDFAKALSLIPVNMQRNNEKSLIKGKQVRILLNHFFLFALDINVIVDSVFASSTITSYKSRALFAACIECIEFFKTATRVVVFQAILNKMRK